MVNIYRHLALSDTPLARTARRVYRGVRNLSVPAPRVVVRPLLWIFLAVRSLYYFVKRVFICEPLFKAYCKSYGRNLHTDVYVHWVQGKGDIIIGDNVEIDGQVAISFAARFSPNPTLKIGDNTIIRHNCSFVVARCVTIGRHCKIAGGVSIFESSGHPSDPEARMAGAPPRPEDVRPITIGDNVWIGQRSIITPGVTIGEGSIVSAASVVLSDVPPYTVVAGYPARKIGTLRNPHAEAPAPAATGTVAAEAS
jgi:acetyltransferase-like isoleucine patch superfamily enzyme